ncbi:MAG: hypothetical protein KJ002_11015, partial [Candidatus Dadabacteria bacterium]|nr:hypothetical protein [Candidatus Dadabacteria bacterium]
GRTYSAAIERRKAFLDISGYDFYPKCVVPRIRESDIDKWFSSLKNIRLADHNNMQTILEIHYHVTNLFADISGLEKRSLASKYLHFHFPKLYYVYDARVRAVVKRFMPVKNSVKHYDGYADNEYRKFYEKCLQIRDNIWEHHRVKLTPRQMDKLFLHLSNDKLRK